MPIFALSYMKSSSLFSVPAILPLMGLLTLSACQAVIFPEDEYSEISEHKLTVITRSTNQSLSLPVQVFAFDSQGRLLDSQSVSSLEGSVALSLPPGKCRIVAAAGREVNDHPTLQDVLQMPDANYQTDPVILGLADVTMGEKSQSLTVFMAHRVAQLQLSLKDVPEDVTDVSVSLSSPYSGMNLQGEMLQPQTAEIPCTKEGSAWTTGVVYVLPTSQQNSVFSIQLGFGEREESYGYTYSAPLVENTPYILTGTYSDGMTLNGGFIVQDWEDAIEHDFHFGPGANTDEEESQEPEQIIPVDEIPLPGTGWDGHVVASVTETPYGADLLLVSLAEWEGLTSAFYEENPNVASDLASQYKEDELKGWRIPAKEEAQLLVQMYVDQLDALNASISAEGGVPVRPIDDKLATVRYLCEDATYSFAFLSGSKMTKAGTKLNTYHLRLVKTVSVAVQ